MQCVNQTGLNCFLKLKKLRLEYLETESGYKDTFDTFVEQLSTNLTLTFIKLERFFTRDNANVLKLRDALKTSKVKKMVLWLYKGQIDATD
mgnify:FL=1